jgi:hypothetical protein
MMKKKVVFSSVLVLIFIIIGLIIYLLFFYKKWEEHHKFITDDRKYSVLILTSCESLSPKMTVRVICKDEIHGYEKKILQKECSFDINSEWFKFTSVNEQKAILTINDYHNPTNYVLNWSEIFETVKS